MIKDFSTTINLASLKTPQLNNNTVNTGKKKNIFEAFAKTADCLSQNFNLKSK